MVVNLQSTGSSARCYIVNGGGQNVPDWLAARKKGERRKKRRTDDGQGIRLIQDFEFPEASNKIRTTRDGQYCLATGTYKPRMKIFDLLELGLKSERVTDAENVDFQILSDDWTKTLHLQTDRSISVHTASSVFYSTRIPTHGRCIEYSYPSCDALIGAQGRQVYRMNLDQGRFLNPLDCAESVEGVNALDINPAHGLLAVGTEGYDGPGTVEFWDLRVRNRVGVLDLPLAQLGGASSFDAGSGEAPASVTAISSREDGLNIAVGTSTGHTLLYDLRASTPYSIKDQGYGLPIKKVQWCYSSGSRDSDEAAGLVASVDSKVLKIWGSQSTQNLISINPPTNINDLHIYPDSGLVFLANEGSPMTSYYIPQLGQAPKWSRFLDNMTEEMEGEQVETIYDDYKFVDRQELQSLGMDHLIGTANLKPYMHGFFVDLRLYTKARAIANPFAFAEHRDRLVREKMEKERESRIRQSKANAPASKKALEGLKAVEDAKVNKDLAERIRQREEKEQAVKERKDQKRREKIAQKAAEGKLDEEPEADEEEEESDSETEGAAPETEEEKAGRKSLLTDSRFGNLFTDPEFQVDEDSLEFAMLNPSTAAKRVNTRDRQSLAAIDEDGQEPLEAAAAEGASDDDDDDSSADEGDLGQYDPRIANGRSAPGTLNPRTGKRQAPGQIRAKAAAKEERAAKSEARRRPRMVVEGSNGETVDVGLGESSSSQQTLAQRAQKAASRSGRAVPRGSRSTVNEDGSALRSTAGGGLEYSFVPSTTSASDAQDEQNAQRKLVLEKQAKEKIQASRVGAGLERDSKGGREQLELMEKLGEDERGGRKRMRRDVRSASRNKTRGL